MQPLLNTVGFRELLYSIPYFSGNEKREMTNNLHNYPLFSAYIFVFPEKSIRRQGKREKAVKKSEIFPIK